MNDKTSSDSNLETSAGPFGTLGSVASGTSEQASHVGTLLCATRMRVGKDLQDVAVVLHIRYNFLVAIEDGRYEDLPGQAYAIGFVRAYADHLGLDGDEVIRRYKEETAGVKRVTRYEYPMSAPESGTPSGALLLIAVVMGMMVYGVWYSMADADRRAADVIQEVPDRLAALLNNGSSTTPEPDAAPEQVADAIVSSEPETDFVPPVVEDDESPSSIPAVDVVRETKLIAPAPPQTQVAASTQPKATPQPEPLVVQPKPAQPDPVVAKPLPAPAIVAPAVDPTPIKAPEKVAEKAPSPAPVVVESPPVVAPAPKPSAAPTQVATVPTTPPVVTPAPKPSAAPTQVATAPITPPLAAAPKATASTPAPLATTPPAVVASSPTAAPKPAAVGAAVPKPATPAAQTASAAKNAVELRAKSDSWIQVRDGEQLLLTRFLRKGESYKVPERPGLTLMTLNAGGIDIMVDGQLMPPLGEPGSVARGVALDAAKLKALPKPPAAPTNPTPAAN